MGFCQVAFQGKSGELQPLCAYICITFVLTARNLLFGITWDHSCRIAGILVGIAICCSWSVSTWEDLPEMLLADAAEVGAEAVYTRLAGSGHIINPKP